MRRTELTVAQILEWADAFYARTGKWPEAKRGGRVWEPPDEKWSNIDSALRLGLRGLHRGQSLARLLAKHRGKRNRKALPKFTSAQILKLADAHHVRTGRWPHHDDGPIAEARGETWMAVDIALRHGQRGLPGDSSLAQLLAAKRDVMNRMTRPQLTVTKILRWADEYKQRTGSWPTEDSGAIPQSNGDTWMAVSKALRKPRRGLRRSSLPQLLARHRRVSRHARHPQLTVPLVLAWADEHRSRTGNWPKTTSGPIAAAPGETWLRVNTALSQGKRGLSGEQSLALLLAQHRAVRSRVFLQPLSEGRILRWARAYKQRHGRWPTRSSGLIPGSDGETWFAVDAALKARGRGLTRRTSLSQLIATQH